MKELQFSLITILFVILSGCYNQNKETSLNRDSSKPLPVNETASSYSSVGRGMDNLKAVYSLGLISVASTKDRQKKSLLYFTLNCKGACVKSQLEDINFMINVTPGKSGKTSHQLRHFKATSIKADADTLMLRGYFQDYLSMEKNYLDLLLERRGNDIDYQLDLDIFPESAIGQVASGDLNIDLDCKDGECVQESVYHCDCLCSFCHGFEQACESEFIKGGLSTEPDGTITCSVQD